MKKVLRSILAVTLAVVIMASLAVTGISVSAASTLYAPTNVRTSNNGTGFYITWNKAANATGYKVYYKTAESDWEFKETNTNSVKIEDLEYGKLYYLQVQTLGRNNAKGGYTKASSMTHVRGTSMTSMVYNTNRSITLGWNEAEGANGYAIAKYHAGKFVNYFYTTDTTYTDTTTVGGTVYAYQINPYYSNGKSAAYAYWTKANALTTLYRPTVHNVNSTPENMNINWNKKIDGAKSYQVAFMRKGDTAWNFRTTTKSYYNVPYPTQGATYYIQVQPINDRLAGQWSEVFTHEVKKAVIPDTTPQVPVISGVTTDYSNMTVNWGKTVNAVKYGLAYKLTTDTTWKTVTTAAQSYTVSNLVQGATYEVKVNAIYKGTQSAYSNVVKATIPKKVEPQPVTEPVTEPITEPVTEPVTEPEVTVSNVSVVAETEGKKEYQKVDNWAIFMNNADGSYGQYIYVAKADSKAKEDAGNSALKAGYMNSRLAYEDENGNPDPSKATIYWEKNDDGATPVAVALRKGTLIDGSDTIDTARDGFIEAYNSNKGKYTFDLPLLEETGVTAKVSWDAVGGEDTYSVQLDKDGAALGDAKTVDGTECTFDGLTDGSYAVVVTPNTNGRAVRKEFTVQTEAEGNNDSKEVTRIQTAVKSLNFCNNCGCWLDGSVFDHIITKGDWDDLKDKAATYNSTSVNALSGVPYYHDHTQYYWKDFTTQDLLEDVHVDPITKESIEKYGVNSGASFVDLQTKATGGRNLEHLRPDGDYTIFLKPGEVPVDMNLAEPYKQGSVVEGGQAYAGNCGLIFVNSRTELDDFVQASMNIAKNKAFVGEKGYALENGRPKIVYKPYATKDFIRFSFMDFHKDVQGCNGGYHNEDVRVITGYEKDMTPETYTAKLIVK